MDRFLYKSKKVVSVFIAFSCRFTSYINEYRPIGGSSNISSKNIVVIAAAEQWFVMLGGCVRSQVSTTKSSGLGLLSELVTSDFPVVAAAEYVTLLIQLRC
jgi:hypothetical protein